MMRGILRLIWQSTSFRVLLALLVFGLSILLMSEPVLSGNVFHAMPYVLVGIPMIALAAIIAAPSIARDLVDRVVDFFTYSEKFDRPQPMYGKAMALRKNRQYEEAMAAYEEIAEDYPDEIKPWLEMIDMSLRELGDPERAERIYQQGVLQFGDEKNRERLARQLSGLQLRS